ncbi:Kinesin protein [Fasciolopsis buskii]|uniref:Kinesin protein n=1 Tax=Fasciolopsis buskii TaxID=27845 RepID=A0A8E0RWS5_9TREM|nr:Kinesin protein [Fasciolopsis buski]
MWATKLSVNESSAVDESAEPQMSVFQPYESQMLSQFCDTEVKESNVAVENQIPRITSRSGKRPPTGFIDPTDWSVYLRICCQLHHIKITYECTEYEAEQILHAGRNNHGSRVIRLICAFNRLYAEYSRLSKRLPKAPYSKRKHVSNFFGTANRQTLDDKQTDPCQSVRDIPTMDAPGMSNTVNRATVSSGCGDTGILNTDITLEPTSLQSMQVVDDSHFSKFKEQSHPNLVDVKQGPACPTPQPAVTQIDPGDILTPYESSASAHTLMNSASTSLHLTNRETSVSSCNGSRCSLASQQPLNRPSNNVCFRWCTRSLRRPDSRAQWNRKREAMRLCKRLQQPGQLDSVGSNSGNRYSMESREKHTFYDQISRAPDMANVLVYQRGNHDYRVDHVVHWIPSSISSNQRKEPNGTEQSNCLTGTKFSTIRLPIALELILPKTQYQIEKVMEHCKNICDPLEVAAELRQLNYDTDACIAYFHKIRHLRDIINEFLPQTTMDNRITVRECQTIPGPSNQYSAYPATTDMPNWSMVSHPDYANTVLTIRDQINGLRKLHVDVTKRLARVRIGTIEMIAKLRTDLEEKVVTKLWAMMSADKTIENKGSCTDAIDTGPGNSIMQRNMELSSSQIAKLVQENQSLKLTLRTEENRRRAIFNMMQEYLGNIRIYCRCRGIPSLNCCIETRPLVDTVLLHNNPDGTNSEVYRFDRVFDVNATQAEVYTELAPSVCSFLDGYNVCFLTYGGEASGKTYTLLGTQSDSVEQQGIAQRALRTVLSEREARMQEWDYHLAIAVVEIYNDTLIDLLSSERGITVRVDSGPDRMLENLQNMNIEQESDIEHLLELCRERRHTGCTALNNQSSRSHLIIFARLSARSRIHDTHVCSLLALCDLAGFEDIIKAETLMDPILAKEAGYINRSLTALNRVFMCLRTQDPSNVSYRDTKLTFLLKPFFTQSGKCILIVTIRTDRNNIASTQSTLRFARDSRGVSLGRARRQFNLDKLIDDMRSS